MTPRVLIQAYIGRRPYLVTTPLIHLFLAMSFPETACALGIRRMYRLYMKPIPSVMMTLPTDTATCGACGWMSLIRCEMTSSHDLSSLRVRLEGVEKRPMAKQRQLEPKPRSYGEPDEENLSVLSILIATTYPGWSASRIWLGFRTYSLMLSILDRQSPSQTTVMGSRTVFLAHYCLSESRAGGIYI